MNEVEEHGHKVQVFTGKWEQVKPGSMTPLQYDQAIGDLVGYMQWMGEPAQASRVRVGVWVLLFLLMFCCCCMAFECVLLERC